MLRIADVKQGTESSVRFISNDTAMNGIGENRFTNLSACEVSPDGMDSQRESAKLSVFQVKRIDANVQAKYTYTRSTSDKAVYTRGRGKFVA